MFGVLLIAVGGALIAGGATSTAAFGAYTPTWEGTGELRTVAEESGAEPTVATNTSAYSNHGNETVAVVIAPTDTYDIESTAAIAAFLDRGGTLVVADRDGTANELLSALDATARIDGTPVRDERHHYRGPALVEATNVSTHPLTTGVDGITLNYGTVVDPGSATVLVSTSEFAYLDSNRNQELDADETMQSRPVVVTEPISDGRLVVVSDPSAFIDVMAERPGNQAFAANLFADHETALIDTSHSGGVPPLVAVGLAIRGSMLAQLGLVIGGLVTLVGWGARRRQPTADRESPDDPPADGFVAIMRRQYPEFDATRLRRITEGVIRSRRKRRDDE